MKFKAKDIVYVVWSCEHISKDKIYCEDKDYYILEDGTYARYENTFAKLSEAKTYARELLDKYNLEVSKYINNVKPTLDT